MVMKDSAMKASIRISGGDKQQGGDLYGELRHHGKKYNKRGTGKAGRGCIPGRIDIAERPAIMEEKSRLGDWEIDTIIGKEHSGGVSLPKRFLIILNGPLFGFLLFLMARGVLQLSDVATSAVAPVLLALQYINLFWTVVNLLRVLPLDGGQLLSVICEGVFGVKGIR